jgi:hypothetical protein
MLSVCPVVRLAGAVLGEGYRKDLVRSLSDLQIEQVPFARLQPG